MVVYTTVANDAYAAGPLQSGCPTGMLPKTVLVMHAASAFMLSIASKNQRTSNLV